MQSHYAHIALQVLHLMKSCWGPDIGPVMHVLINIRPVCHKFKDVFRQTVNELWRKGTVFNPYTVLFAVFQLSRPHNVFLTLFCEKNLGDQLIVLFGVKLTYWYTELLVFILDVEKSFTFEALQEVWEDLEEKGFVRGPDTLLLQFGLWAFWTVRWISWIEKS